MTFPLDWIFYLNIVIVVIFIATIISLTRKGLLLGLVQLLRVVIALVAAMILSGPLAQVFPLLNYKSGGVETVIANLLSTRASQPLWFVIVVLVVFVLTKLLEPLIKLLDEAPILGSINRLGGFVLGILVGAFKVVLILILFTTTLFSNGEEVINESYLVIAKESLSVVDGFAQPLSNNIILQKYSANETLTSDEEAVVEEWMNDKGIGHDQIVDFLESLKNE